ncbi:hypothetical protein ASC91_13215 [Pelomonas sp. Root1237]|nr:hypothetical protein ASC91_13215 [Pelomonas sp. Root1237]
MIQADVTDSKAKAGIWFSEQKGFKSKQKKVMECIASKVDWIKLPGAILAISQKPHGIVVIAPNPSLPGIIVLADGTTKSNTEALQRRYTKLIEECTKSLSIATEKTETKN